MIVQAFETKKAIGGIETGLDVLNVFGTAPIMDGGAMIATMDIGAPFGETFVKTTKARFGVEVAIHQLNGDTPKTLASTLAGSRPSKELLQRALGGETVIETGVASEGRPVADHLRCDQEFLRPADRGGRDRARRQRLPRTGA